MMASGTQQAPRSWERRMLHREILKYGGSMLQEPELYQDDDFNSSMLLGCHHTTPQLAADATLTGFAQLAALRMNCKHGFISLIDDKYQHVLAEATRTISPYDADIHGPGDELLVGARTLDIDFGICPLTLAAFSKGSAGWVNTEITFADDSKYIISDLLKEPRVSKARFMEDNTTSRFYAEVPLRSSEGLVIGSVSVIDETPRSNPSTVQVRPLQDIALMTMDHFDLIHIREVSLRAERLMQGLGHFNSGKSSISQWIMDNPDRALARDGEDYYIQTPGTMGLTPSLDEIVTARADEMTGRGNSNLSPNMQMRGYFDRRISNSNIGTPSETPTGANGLLTSHPQPDVQGNVSFPVHLPEAPRSNHIKISTSSKPNEIVHSRVSSDIHDAFSRASNLIRQSMDLDATCFLEISPDARFRIRSRRDSEDDCSSPNSATSSTKKSKQQRIKSIKTEATATATLPGTKVNRISPDVNKTRLCNRLGLAMRSKSNIIESASVSDFATFPELSLSKLAAEFPGGHIFKFDSFGALSVNSDSKRTDKHEGIRQKFANLMVKHFPEARSLIFMPLYDNEKQHLYAGFFGWTTNPKRVLLDNESVYVLGFANSIMCEVMRLETLAVEKAKSDFMSSMSHELRSPLHGILGATQLLQESEMPPSLRELATMIDSCGRTLLDIMNNLLEHAKINNISNGAVRGRRGSKLTIEDADNESTLLDSQLESVDLATLVEETVTSVAAGHAVREHRSEQTSARRKASSRAINGGNPDEDDLGPDGIPLPPAVIIDILSRPNWVFQTEAGSWRRIVMNLVGNALKYTQRGRIDVSIEIVETEDGEQTKSDSKAVLTVQDTGQGISDSYLKHRLYTPFAQENNLSVGAGLGLSIVNRLVSALNGTIHVESELNVGTKVTVTVPISQSGPGHISLVRSNSVTTIEEICLSIPEDELICFIGFDNDTRLAQGGVGTTIKQISARSQTSTLHRLKETITKLCTSWLNLTSTDDTEKATLIVIEEGFAKKLLKQDSSHPVHRKRLIVVNVHDRAGQNEQRWPGRCAFLSVPIGPVKFARVLSTVLQQDSRKSELPEKHTDKRSISRVLSPKDRVSPHPMDRSASPGEPPTKRQRLATAGPGNNTNAMNGVSKSTENINPNADCRVLLVEDNMINLKLLASFMRKLDFPYTTATNGQEALDEYIGAHEDGESFRYVFMDITMPVMDGLTSTRRIRAYEKTKRIKQPVEIIALTGLGHVEAQNEALTSGVDQYFCKPVRLDALRKLLIEKES